jgi:hypothetical protein
VLVNNGTYVRARFLGGALGDSASVLGVEARRRIANAQAFGNDTSWPQGYQSVTRAMTPPLVESGQIAARLGLVGSLDADLRGIGGMTAAAAFDVNMTTAANVLSNLYATFEIDLDATAALRAQGALSAVFDIISRPSANDISQEIWNSFQVETGFSAADALRVILASLAGKVSGAAGTTVTIRDVNDTRDRIVATVDENGNRTAVTLDADA